MIFNCSRSERVKDAYYSVHINKNDQKFFKFEHKGSIYKYVALPNGFSPGLRKFTKILKVPLSILRRNKISIVAYINDLISLENSYDTCQQNVWKIITLLDQLGFVVHPDKSVFSPTQEIEYLGFFINSKNMTIKLTLEKKEDLKQLALEILGMKIQKIKLLGKITSSFPGSK